MIAIQTKAEMVVTKVRILFRMLCQVSKLSNSRRNSADAPVSASLTCSLVQAGGQQRSAISLCNRTSSGVAVNPRVHALRVFVGICSQDC